MTLYAIFYKTIYNKLKVDFIRILRMFHVKHSLFFILKKCLDIAILSKLLINTIVQFLIRFLISFYALQFKFLVVLFIILLLLISTILSVKLYF